MLNTAILNCYHWHIVTALVMAKFICAIGMISQSATTVCIDTLQSHDKSCPAPRNHDMSNSRRGKLKIWQTGTHQGRRHMCQTGCHFRLSISRQHQGKHAAGLSLGLFIMTGLLSIASAQGALISWTDPTPSALQPFAGQPAALAGFAGRDLLVYPQPVQTVQIPGARRLRRYEQAQYVSSAVVLPIPAEQVQQQLTRFAGYVGLFPNLTRAELVARDASRIQMRYRMTVKSGLPLLNFNEHFTVQHQLGQNSLSSLLIDGPLQYGTGRFEWFSLGPQRTLVTFTHFADLYRVDQFLLRRILQAMPEIRTGIPPATGVYMLEALRQRAMADDRTAYTVDAIIPATDQMSQTSQPIYQRLLAAGGYPVIRVHPPRYLATPQGSQQLRFVTHITTINRPLSVTYTTLADPLQLQNLFPRQIRRVTVQPYGQTSRDARLDIGIGLGIIHIPFRMTLRYTPEPQQAIRIQGVGGDIEHLYARYQLTPLGQQATRVSLTTASQITDRAPFLLRIGRNMPFPDLLPSVGSGPVMLERIQQRLEQGYPAG